MIVFGDFQYPAKMATQYGTITWSDKENIVQKDTTVDAPNLVAIKQFYEGLLSRKQEIKNNRLIFLKMEFLIHHIMVSMVINLS